MTVSSTSSRVVYTGNGVTTVFPFAFKVQQAADLVVVYTDTTGTDFTLSPSQYAASGFGLDAGGSVTYPTSGSPIATGTTLTIYRDVAATQPTSISNQGAMWPQVIEAALDRLTFIVQKVTDTASRSLVISPTDSGALDPLPTTLQRANSMLGFDSSGQPYAAQLIAGLGAASTWIATNFLPAISAAAARLSIGAAGTADNNAFTGTNTFPTQAAGDNSTKAATTAYADRASAGPVVRQTVASGPVDANGLPTFFPATVTGLVLTTQNVSSTYPLVATAANGWSATTGAPVDAVGFSAANLAWPAAANGATNYAYATIANGVLTPAYTPLLPIYQFGGVPGTAAGQITFNIAEMRAYLGNGTTAPQTNLVLFGEVVTSGGNITSTVGYAYNGRYDSGWTASLPSPSAILSKNHNLGRMPQSVDLIVECTTTDAGWQVGAQHNIKALGSADGAARAVPTIGADRLTATFVANSITTFYLSHKSTTAVTNLTAANWRYKITARL